MERNRVLFRNKPLDQKGSIMIAKRRMQLLSCMAVLALAAPMQVAFGHDWDHDHWGHHDHDFPPFGHDHDFPHHHDHAGAAVAAGILGLAIAAAVADNGSNRPHDVYAPQPQPYYAPPPPYRLSQGITCYPAQRACYLPNGHYAGITTHSQFGN
ncbi:ABC-type Zn2+ transport system substrate-binding protein/surface adhesin [Ochrobactrum sp. RH2CCR150]|nr:ABC-type Zn2+ transport system substrate-binding protein/surface adhesin [Ochrobactrum sp. RH2CCR150]